jgi:hypothetical protein
LQREEDDSKRLEKETKGANRKREFKRDWGREWKKIRLKFQVGKTSYLRANK